MRLGSRKVSIADDALSTPLNVAREFEFLRFTSESSRVASGCQSALVFLLTLTNTGKIPCNPLKYKKSSCSESNHKEMCTQTWVPNTDITGSRCLWNATTHQCEVEGGSASSSVGCPNCELNDLKKYKTCDTFINTGKIPCNPLQLKKSSCSESNHSKEMCTQTWVPNSLYLLKYQH